MGDEFVYQQYNATFPQNPQEGKQLLLERFIVTKLYKKDKDSSKLTDNSESVSYIYIENQHTQ